MDPSDIKQPCTNTGIKALLWNANGLRNKTHYLEHLITTFKPPLIAITETKLDHSINDSELCHGYTIYRRDRRGSLGLGGGVLIGVLDASPMRVTKVYTDDSGELISLSITVDGFSFVLACYYRAPNSRSLDTLFEWFADVCNPNIVVMGDFNLPDLKWAKDHPKPSEVSGLSTLFTSFLTVNNINQYVNVPTHNKGNILDLILATTPISDVQCEASISDHYVITSLINTPEPVKDKGSTSHRSKWLFLKADIPSLRLNLLQLEHTMETMLKEPNISVDSVWLLFKTGLLDASNKYIPKLKCNIKRPKPWISRNTIRQIRKRNRLFKVNSIFPTAVNSANLLNQSKLCKRLVKNDYHSHLNQRLCKELENGNNKPLFKFIADKRGQKNAIKSLDGTSPDNPADISNCFAKAFASVYSPLDDKSSERIVPANIVAHDNPIKVSQDGVLKLLNSLDPRKGEGPDGLNPALLRFVSKDIAKMTTRMIQLTLDVGSVPTEWKMAHIVPIYKNKGSRTAPLNYRPISLTSVLSKTTEHIIASHIRRHLDANNLLVDCQHGFRTGRSCDSQLLTTVTDLVNSYDCKVQTDVIILDFAKAFDVVPFAKLLDKIAAMGVHPTIIDWVKAWLTNRTSTVIANDTKSLPLPVTSGVPQGSVLGPLLFLIYINDMPVCVRSNLRLFADDSLLYREIKTPADTITLQSDLDALSAWAAKWQMRFNVSKCEHASIKPGSGTLLPTTYKLNDQPINKVSEFKYLGVIIDDRLSFEQQVNTVCKKASSLLHMLMRNLKHALRTTKTIAFNSICRPILEYACTTWSPRLNRQSESLEAVNRKAYRWVFRLSRRDHISQKMIDSGWRTLKHRREEADTKMLTKILDGKIAIPIGEYKPDRRTTRTGLVRDHLCTDVKRYAFFNRAISGITETQPDKGSLV